MKNWKPVESNTFYKQIVNLTVFDEQGNRKNYIGYKSKFYDDKNDIYIGVEVIAQVENEISNCNMIPYYGTTDENEKNAEDYVEIANNGTWFIFINY